jgi:hypothetical protein
MEVVDAKVPGFLAVVTFGEAKKDDAKAGALTYAALDAAAAP